MADIALNIYFRFRICQLLYLATEKVNYIRRHFAMQLYTFFFFHFILPYSLQVTSLLRKFIGIQIFLHL